VTTGTFELAEQRGNKGYYGKVLIQVEPDPTLRGCEISFDEPNAGNAEWRDAAKFGIEYAYAHIPKKERASEGHRIRVQTIRGHPFDTNGLIIAYAAVCALLRAFGKSEAGLVSLDPDAGTVVFAR
jgi:hypothetical protein